MTLASLTGTWRRRWIRRPGAPEDATTRVWWVQATRYYGDLRLPRHRPAFNSVRSLAQCTRDQIEWLATQEGFAGELTKSRGVFHWWRDVDFQPFNGRRDVGRLTYDNRDQTLMTEVGAEEPHTELWERSAESPADVPPVLVTRLERPGGRGWFVGVGGEFVLAFDRRPALPAAASLAALVAGATLRDSARWLDMEVSFGRRDRDEGRNGTIIASTLPWREGELAFPNA